MGNSVLAAWREIRSIVMALGSALCVALLTRQRILALLLVGLLGWVFYFFRDPERTPAASAPRWILSPADGKVTDIEPVHDPLFFKGPAQRVSLFLSLFDVHVQRSPYQGQVQFLHYQPGSFAPAFLRNTSENEYNFIGLSTPRGRLGVKQISGVLARRIVCWPGLGDELATGQRLGLIKFGSRVDLLLPPEVEIVTYVGQQLHGGQSVVARWLE